MQQSHRFRSGALRASTTRRPPPIARRSTFRKIASALKGESRPTQRKLPKYNPDDHRNGDYKLISHCEKSADGQVTILESKATGLVVVRKHTRPIPIIEEFRIPQDGKDFMYPNESYMLKHHIYAHRNIIRGYEVVESRSTEGSYNLFYEYCSGGDLWKQFEHWWDRKLLVPIEFVAHLMVELIEALAHIHTGDYSFGFDQASLSAARHKTNSALGVVQGDLKPENIFLKWEPGMTCLDLPTIVLGDFGAAKMIGDKPCCRNVGTSLYHAPEEKALYDYNPEKFGTEPGLVENFVRKRNQSGDIYSAGLIFRHAILNEPDFDYYSKDLRFYKKDQAKYPHVTDMIAGIMNMCLDPYPQHRGTADHHPITGLLPLADKLRIFINKSITSEQREIDRFNWRSPPGNDN